MYMHIKELIATYVCMVYKQRKSVLLCYLLYQIHFLYTRKANGMVVAKQGQSQNEQAKCHKALSKIAKIF